MHPDPLQTFIDKLGGAIPLIIILAVAGAVLGLLFRAGENFIVRSIRSILFLRSSSSRNAKPSSPSHCIDAPHCPSCNRVMVKRKARRGPNTGEEFWGCPNYPECRGTRPILD